jgi:hypothetical protein
LKITTQISRIQNLSAALILSSFCILVCSGYAVPMTFEAKKMEFINRIPEIAEKFIGIPYEYGGDFEESGVLDNSHLFYLIYDEAARRTGLQWEGDLRMSELFEHSVEIKKEDLRNGDLVFLKNGHAAMIYKYNNQDNFNLIYSSYKRKQVITFHCKNVAFKVYWLKNLKGYYRPTDSLLSP